MAYAQQFALSRSQTFRDAMGGALLALAANMTKQAEPALPTDGTATAQQIAAHAAWDARQVWADDVLGTSTAKSNIMRWIDVAMPLVLQNSTVVTAGETVTDATLDTALLALVNQFAKRRLT